MRPMKTTFNRISAHAAALLLAAVGLVSASTSLAHTASQTPPAELFTVKPLGHNVFAAVPNPGSGAGGNSGFIIGDDGVLVVDTFQTEAAARQLVAAIKKQTQLPIKFAVNTHYHLDHVAGNAVLSEAGAAILAQKNVRDWIHTENMKFFPTPTDAQKALVANLHAPDLVYDRGIDIFLGAKHIVIRYELGHTGGDSVIFVPDANVLFTGDLFWRHSLPNLIDASTEPMLATLQSLVAAHPDATFVPGHGDVGTAQDVTAFRGYIVDIRQFVGDARVQGLSGDAMAEKVSAQLKEKYGDWGIFDRFVKRNIADTEAELNAKKKIPVPTRDPAAN